MIRPYLDYNGLSRFKDKLDDIIDPIEEDLGDLKSAMGQLYDSESVVDEFGSNASVAKNWKTSFLSPSWDSATKTLSVTMTASHTSADTYYVSLAPKFVSGHKYVVAMKYTLVNSHYIYVMNCFSQSNMNSGDKFLWGELRSNGATDAVTFTATSDGWLTLGVRLIANTQENWAFGVAVYDVTGYDVSGIDSAVWTALSDVVTLSLTGIVPIIQEKADYSYAFDSNVIGEKWTALGDSLTATGSGGYYLTYVTNRLDLAKYKNCGIGGTTISGAENTNAMYQSIRIETLDIDSNCVTVMGGSNDFWQEYYKDHPNSNLTGWGDCTRDNHDVTTFCGAYNVLISKVLYKFCKVPAYYSDVDYTGITQVSTAIDNFRLILLTPPQVFYVEGGSASATLLQNGITAAHDNVKQIAKLWGLPCVDTWEMGMNDINKPLFFANYLTDATHFNAFGHERLASLLIDKALQISRYK